MIDSKVQTVIDDIAAARGESFFPRIVQTLGSAIKADITFIATVSNDYKQATTLAMEVDGGLAEPLTYDLKDTPCEKVSDDCLCMHEGDAQTLYPKDELLVDLGVNSYIGIPLHNSNNQVIGILAGLYRGCIPEADEARALFLLFSGLISTELDRQSQLRDYKLASSVIENVNEAVIITDAEQRISYVNPSFEKITGYSTDEVLGKSPKILGSGQHSNKFYEEMWDTIGSQQNWSGEIWNKRKNGEIYPEWLSINVIRNEKNEISHYVGFFSDITERKRTEDELNFQSNYDSLTQLPNMEQFIRDVEQRIHNRHQEKFAVAIIDIDNFRGVNDSYGHSFGNRFIQKVAQRLSLSKRSQDMLSRFSGDQFPIIIHDIEGPHEAAKIISDIQRDLKAPFYINNQEVSITSRAGVSIYPEDSRCAEQLVSNANQALVYAEQQTDNRYSFFAPSMRDDSERRMFLKSAIKKSIEKDLFSLAFQPIIDLNKKRISKCEVLVRWKYEGNWISPAEFIPVAEEFDLIKPLGERILEMSCQALQRLRQSGFDDIQFAVNRSVHEFPTETEGSDYWLAVLDRYEIPHSAICFEITESVLAPDSKSQIDLLNELKARGCSLAIDDFGTGYSSLSYLRKFPVDVLKIDRSFISHQQASDNDWTLVGSIIAMAEAMGHKVVAEGVESTEQLDELIALGCDYVQGYLTSKPMPENELHGFISSFDFETSVCSRGAANVVSIKKGSNSVC